MVRVLSILQEVMGRHKEGQRLLDIRHSAHTLRPLVRNSEDVVGQFAMNEHHLIELSHTLRLVIEFSLVELPGFLEKEGKLPLIGWSLLKRKDRAVFEEEGVLDSTNFNHLL